MAVLGTLNKSRNELADQHEIRVPLVVKVAPDLEDLHIPQIAKVVVNCEFDGLIADNTTTSRVPLKACRMLKNKAPLVDASFWIQTIFSDILFQTEFQNLARP